MSHSYRQTLQRVGFFAGLALAVYSIYGDEHRRFYSLPEEAELSNPTVLCINKDSRGFLWIGTQDGLNRYDGYKCKQYRWEREGGLSISYINDVEEGPDGNIWICSHEGLFKLDIETENISYAFQDNSPILKTHGDMITRIDFDPDGKMWVGSYYGLLHYDPETGDYDLYTHDPNDPESIPEGWERIRCMCLVGKKNLWIGTFAGLMVLDIESGHLERVTFDEFGIDPSQKSQIFDIRLDRNGTLWISTQSNGLIAIDSTTREGIPFNYTTISRKLRNNAIYGTTEDSKGRLWIGTDHGLYCYDPVWDTLQSFTHDIVDPYSIGEDIISIAPLINNDMLWLPTRYAGVWFTDLRPSFFTPYTAIKEGGLDHSVVSSFAEDQDGNLIIATDGGGLNMIDMKDGSFSYYRKGEPPFMIPTNKTLAVIVDRRGRYWIGTWNRGLVRYDPSTGEQRIFRSEIGDPASLGGMAVFYILEDRKGSIWVGTWDGGVSRYDETNDRFINYVHNPDYPNSLVEAPITFLMEDHRGNIWASSEIGGLSCLNPETGTFKNYQHESETKSINSNSINCLWEDPRGLIYIGTNAGGLNILDPDTDTFLDNPLNEGTICSSVFGIESDPHGMVWVSTNNGLIRYNRETSLLNIYSKNDGIHDNRFGRWAFKRLNSGDLLFGGSNGFTWIHSDGTNEEEVFPDPAITEVWVNDEFYTSCIREKAKVGGNRDSGIYKLPSNVKSLRVEFTTPWYRGKDRIKFEYKLEGIDSAWVPALDTRMAQYRNLSHGSYEFKVRISNLAGRWNEKIASFPFTIRTPWVARWYSKILFWLLGMAMVMLLIRWRVYQYRMRGIRLEKRIHDRTRDLNESNRQLSEKKHEIEMQNRKLTQLNLTKDKMLSIFAHDIKNPFNALLSLSEILNSDYDNLTDTERKEYIEFVRIASNNIYELLENLLYWSISRESKLPYRPKWVDIHEVFDPAYKLYKVIAAQKSIHLECEMCSGNLQLKLDSQLITMVFRNLLNNAIKFTPVEGKITITCQETEKEVIFCVSDTGNGMPDEQADRLFKHPETDDVAIAEEADGTGLGLPLCREIVELHQGQIYKDKAYTEGLRICFTIPVEVVDRKEAATADMVS